MNKRYTSIPAGMAECPVCNGTGHGRPLSANELRYKVYAGRTHHECGNCGGQTMSGKAVGYVHTRPDGTACKHEVTEQSIGRCLHLYTCKHCKASYTIDSGD